MPIVTVQGAHDQSVKLTYDSNATAAIARNLAAAITASVQANTMLPADSKDGPPPTLPGGKLGEFVQSTKGLTILPSGYNAVVNSSHGSVIFGSGGKDESVLSSNGGLT